jgi:hypothetical protein
VVWRNKDVGLEEDEGNVAAVWIWGWWYGGVGRERGVEAI